MESPQLAVSPILDYKHRASNGADEISTKRGSKILPSESFQERQPTISSGVGKRPVAFFENASRPSTLISKTPPLDRRRFNCADGCCLRMRSRAARARGS
jgi:hypothetical protein